VVIPVRNRAATLPRQLASLEEQRYRGDWEVVVADNGSTDGSQDIARRWLDRSGRGVLVSATERDGPSHARNVGAAAARGEFLAFCDADDAAAPGWLDGLTGAAPQSDLVAGRLEVEDVNDPLPRSWYRGPHPDRPFSAHGFLPFASGANVGVWAEVFNSLRGFDEQLRAGEDIDLSWRAQLAGFRLAFAADALICRRYESSLGGLARQHYGYGKGNAQLFQRFRSAGMPRPGPRDLLGEWGWIAAHLPVAARDPSVRGRLVRRVALRCGQMAGSVRERVLFP
jgi:glycosyltransferase involved in cell wall biosynthesis